MISINFPFLHSLFPFFFSFKFLRNILGTHYLVPLVWPLCVVDTIVSPPPFPPLVLFVQAVCGGSGCASSRLSAVLSSTTQACPDSRVNQWLPLSTRRRLRTAQAIPTTLLRTPEDQLSDPAPTPRQTTVDNPAALVTVVNGTFDFFQHALCPLICLPCLRHPPKARQSLCPKPLPLRRKPMGLPNPRSSLNEWASVHVPLDVASSLALWASMALCAPEN